ncbi:MAG TPA: MgtC/SapB family protein [Candidatus Baltobacteraceae bacterium]|nr:MgtC/SapB family protein [Candidatus Baltobacteraceae bacterium]
MIPSLQQVPHYLPAWDMLVRLAVGTLAGFTIGLERQLRHRAAGLQTSTLVTVGAALFATIAPSFGATDLRIIANVVTGVGFLAGGVILKDGGNVSGLNTAATMWAAAAVGALAGVGLFYECAVGAFVIVGLNATMGPLAHYIDKRKSEQESGHRGPPE